MSQRPIFEGLLSEALPHLIRLELRRQTTRVDGHACPDANALAAYVERNLDTAEKQAVVQHLNACQSCRMSVAFAVRAGQAAEPSSLSHATLLVAPARSPFLLWGVAGGVAAGLLAAFVMFWQHPPAPRTTAELVRKASVQMPGATTEAQVSRASAPSFLLPGARRIQAQRHARQAPLLSHAPVVTEASATPPSVAPKSSVPAPIRQGFATLTPPSRTSLASMLPGMGVASTALHSGDSSTMAVRAGNTPPANGADSLAPSTLMASSFLGSPVTAQPHVSLVSSGSRPSSDRLGFSRFLAQGSPGPEWRISPGGVLEHAAGRGAWARVPLQAAGRVVSLTVSGAHLWVVSQTGALYHSADAGQNWHPVHVDLDRHAMQDAIVGIHFADQRQGELMTRSGAHWFTVDGGHFWRPVIAPSLTPGIPVQH